MQSSGDVDAVASAAGLEKREKKYMEVASRKGGGAALLDWLGLIITLGGVALGALIVLKSTDPVFQLHFGIIAVFALLGAIFLARKAFSSTETMDLNAYSDNVVKYATVATVLWGIVGFLSWRYHRISARLPCAEP